jgi:hypothetical protein
MCRAISCGSEHSAFVFSGDDQDESVIYTVGRGDCGQLGHTERELHTITPSPVVHPVLAGRKIESVVCGEECTFIIAGYYQPKSLVSTCTKVLGKSKDGLLLRYSDVDYIATT